MKIGYFNKFSLIDFPGKISCIVFTIGCNFRCPYCHNPELVLHKFFPKPIIEKDFFNFLKKRKGKLEGVVITGGEPLLQNDILDFLDKIKSMGFLVKLDTNGSFPEILEKAIMKNLLDYIAMDIKAPFDLYPLITQVKVDIQKIKKSIDLIMNSGISYEFRTTVVKNLLKPKDIIKIAHQIKGAKLYVLQKFVSQKAIDKEILIQDTYSDEKFEEIKKNVLKYVRCCIIR